MKQSTVKINWPDGQSSYALPGSDWFSLAKSVGISIPSGCLGGSCGACEIEVNGEVVRACISNVPCASSGEIRVRLEDDPYW